MNRWMSILGIALTVFLLLPDLSAADTPKFSDWSAPVNLGAVVNSASADVGPAISKDGLSLYFSSDRVGGFGDFDIYVSQRRSKQWLKHGAVEGFTNGRFLVDTEGNLISQ